MEKLSSKQEARRLSILDAGQAVILRSGSRAATMEAIALQAGVAKPTLYKYFPDKTAIHEALILRLSDELRSVFDAALAQDVPVAQRIGAALTAQKKIVHRLLHSSPHAQELAGDDMARDVEVVRALERHTEDEIRLALTPQAGEGARNMAQLLMACANGIGRQAKYAEQIGPAIRLTVTKLLA